MSRHVPFVRPAAVVAVLTALASVPALALAQTPANPVSLRIISGAMMPVGAQRSALRSAPLTAAQVSWSPRPSLAVTGTIGWAVSRDRLAAGTPKVDAFTADVGAEFRAGAKALTGKSSLSPFVGFGAGARRYDSRAATADAAHNLAGYAAVGGELLVGRVGIRVEARDYVGGFKPIASGSRAGSDVVVMTALRLVRRSAPQH